jgi:alpha-L-rhamnosidase
VAARLGNAPLQESPGGLRALLSVITSDGRRLVFATTAAGFRSVGGPSAVAASNVTSWRCALGASLFDHIYDGHTYDATRATTGWDMPGFDDSGWAPALLAADPGGAAPTTMTAQASFAIASVAEYPALLVTSPQPGVFVVDFGSNIAGFVRLRLPAPVPRNATIVIRHGELLMHEPYGPADGSIYTGNLRSALATDSYTTFGSTDEDEVYEPMFTYHGFRFIEVSGLPLAPTPGMFTAVSSRSSVPVVGEVAFPAATARVLNQLQAAAQASLGANLMGLNSDCPQRDERKGWLGDSALSLFAAPYNYDLAAFYTLWAAHMRDAQRSPLDAHPDGSLPDTVPHTFAEYPADPAWGSAYPGVIHTLWRTYGDLRAAAEYFDDLKRYINFLQLQVEGEGDAGIGALFGHYGDWVAPPGPGTGHGADMHFTSGIALLVDLERMVELATALGRADDAANFTAYRGKMIAQFNAAWLGDAASGIHEPG